MTSKEPLLSKGQAAVFLTAVCLSAIMTNLDFTAVNLAVLPMAEDFHVSVDDIQWILSAYLLAFSSMLLPAGGLSDRIGHRKTFTLGIGLFTGTSAIIAMAPSHYVVIVGRIIQGAGGSLIIPGIYGLIGEVLTKKQQAFAVSVIGAGLGIGMSLGPTFGGILIEYFGWPMIFWVNLPIGIFTILSVLKTVPKSKAQHAGKHMDWKGIIAFVGGLSLILYALGNAHTWGWGAFRLWGLIATGIALIAICIYWERHIERPLIHLNLLKEKTYRTSCLSFIGFNASFIAIVFIVGLLLLSVWDYSPMQAGFIMLGMTALYGIFAPVVGILLGHMRPLGLILLGFVLMIGSMAWIMFMPVNDSLASWVTALVITGTGMSLTWNSINAVMMGSLPQEEIGAGSSMFLMLGIFAGSLALVISTTIATGTLLNELEDYTQTHEIHLSQTQEDALIQAAQIGYFNEAQKEALGKDVFKPLQAILVQHVHHGLNLALGMCIVLCLISAAFSLHGFRGVNVGEGSTPAGPAL